MAVWAGQPKQELGLREKYAYAVVSKRGVRVSKLILPKVSGASAIVAAVLFLSWFWPTVEPMFGIRTPTSLKFEDWARFKLEHYHLLITVDWLVIIGLVCELVALVGFFYIIRHVGPLTWLGLAAWFTGLLLVMFEHVIVLGVDSSLIPKYLAATESAKPALEVLASTLNRIRLVAATVGNHLDLGLGVPVLALASLRIRQVPKWVGWLGVLVGVSTWIPLHYWPSPNFIGFVVWLIAMGITWLRLKEPVEITGVRSVTQPGP